MEAFIRMDSCFVYFLFADEKLHFLFGGCVRQECVLEQSVLWRKKKQQIMTASSILRKNLYSRLLMPRYISRESNLLYLCIESAESRKEKRRENREDGEGHHCGLFSLKYLPVGYSFYMSYLEQTSRYGTTVSFSKAIILFRYLLISSKS